MTKEEYKALIEAASLLKQINALNTRMARFDFRRQMDGLRYDDGERATFWKRITG